MGTEVECVSNFEFFESSYTCIYDIYIYIYMHRKSTMFFFEFVHGRDNKGGIWETCLQNIEWTCILRYCRYVYLNSYMFCLAQNIGIPFRNWNLVFLIKKKRTFKLPQINWNENPFSMFTYFNLYHCHKLPQLYI